MKKNTWIKYDNCMVFKTYDNSYINEIGDEVELRKIALGSDNGDINLGIHKFNNNYYTSNRIGVTWLKDNDDNIIINNDGLPIVIKIDPRFDISTIEMLELIKDDDEFDRYLAPQSIRLNDNDSEINAIEDNEIFKFYLNEQPIFLKDNTAKDSSVLTSMIFLTMLNTLCKKPLMGKMITHENNMVGKVRGKIMFTKHIRQNVAKGREDRVFCKYLRYSEDILENQLLKAALKKAKSYLASYFKQVNSSKGYSEMLRYTNKTFSNVTDMSLKAKDCNNAKVSGCYAYYKPVLNLAKMVLSEITLEASGKTNTTSYVVPYSVSMEKLFEFYIRAFMKKCGVLSYKSKEPTGIQLGKYDEKKKVLNLNGEARADYIAGVVKPDIILKDIVSGDTVVFDVKYKKLTNKKNARSDRLQILAYALMYSCRNVGIIFPTLDENQSFYFAPQAISRLDENRTFYHQLAIDISGSRSYTLKSKADLSDVLVYRYIEKLFETQAKSL
jgi:5-methylcytosine-specific restriction endonuclease McrBC regulatory subunit McrC